MPTLIFDHDWAAAPTTSVGAAGTTSGAGRDGLWLDLLGGAAHVATDGTGTTNGLRATTTGTTPTGAWNTCRKLMRPVGEGCSDGDYHLWLPADPDLTTPRHLILLHDEADRSGLAVELNGTGNPDQYGAGFHACVDGNQVTTQNLYVNGYLAAHRHEWVFKVRQPDAGTTTVQVLIYDLDGADPSVAMPMFSGVDTVEDTTAGIQRPGTFSVAAGGASEDQFYTRIRYESDLIVDDMAPPDPGPGEESRVTVSVLDFGALGDGIADDRAAFMAALASEDDTLNRLTVTVPPGDYRLSTSVVLHRSHLSVVGEGVSSIVRLLEDVHASAFILPRLWGDPYSPNLVVDGCSIERLTIDGNHNDEAESGGGQWGVFAQAAINLTIRGCWIRNWYHDGVTFSNGNRPVVAPLLHRCRITTTARSGIHLGFTDGAIVRECRVDDVPSQFWGGSSAHAIDVEVEGYDYYSPPLYFPYVRDTLIEDCILQRALCDTMSNGVALQAAYGALHGITIRRCVIVGHAFGVQNTFNGTRFDGRASVDDVTLDANWMNSARYPNHAVTGNPVDLIGSEHVAVTGNTFNDHSGAIFSYRGAVHANNCIHLAVTDNVTRLSKFLAEGETVVCWIEAGDDIAVTGNQYQTPGDIDVFVDPAYTTTNLTVAGNTPLDHAGWDNTPPTCTFALAEGATIAAATDVAVTASADASGIDRVFFFVDGIPAGYSDAAPYTFAFDPADHPDGAHVLSAMAVDGQANLGDEVFLTVNTSAPDSIATRLLLEGGDALLLESGDALLREAGGESAAAGVLLLAAPDGGLYFFQPQG